VIVAGILSPIENALSSVLEWLHGTIGLPWAWSIVALTVVVRFLLVPLTVKQIRSMQNMQRFAPQMKEIQKKYKGDRQKLNEELMKFYKENKINPAASCLPMVFQLPIFFALYFVLRNFTQHAGNVPVHDLGWLHIVPNITAKASSHWSGYLLLAVYALSQVGSTLLMSTTMDKMQRRILLVLPLVFIVVVARFPIGLLLYWVTTNLWTVGQGIVTRTLIPKTPVYTPPKRSSRTPKEVDDDGAGNGAKSEPEKPKPAPAAARPSQPRKVKRKKSPTRKGGR
jgi:YidC/Oxa1 family membrane protein insertase